MTRLVATHWLVSLCLLLSLCLFEKCACKDLREKELYDPRELREQKPSELRYTTVFHNYSYPFTWEEVVVLPEKVHVDEIAHVHPYTHTTP
jgi:hypothetical protein